MLRVADSAPQAARKSEEEERMARMKTKKFKYIRQGYANKHDIPRNNKNAATKRTEQAFLSTFKVVPITQSDMILIGGLD